MRVSFSVDTTRYTPPAGEGSVAIEFAIPAQNGNSSAGERHGYTEQSVRLAWRNAEGTFDPISSAELPVWGLMDVVTACAAANFFSAREAVELINVLSASAQRQI